MSAVGWPGDWGLGSFNAEMQRGRGAERWGMCQYSMLPMPMTNALLGIGNNENWQYWLLATFPLRLCVKTTTHLHELCDYVAVRRVVLGLLLNVDGPTLAFPIAVPVASKKYVERHKQLVGEVLFARLAGLDELADRRDDFICNGPARQA